jgi:hypothetical protein
MEATMVPIEADTTWTAPFGKYFSSFDVEAE